MKATSAIDVCNLALGELGAKVISTIIAPKTAEESICARHYDNTRRALLRTHVWNFAKKRSVISRSGTPAFDFSDAYKLPNNYIRYIRAKTTDNLTISNLDYDIAEGELLLNADGASMINFAYVFDNELVAQWDPLFLRLMVLSLAKDMSYEITRKNAVKESILSEINLIEGRIKGIDGQERPPRRVETSAWLNRRDTLTNNAPRFNGLL